MRKDRRVIIRIMSEMFDKVDENGTYLTSACYDELERYVEFVRVQVVEEAVQTIGKRRVPGTLFSKVLPVFKFKEGEEE